MARARGPDEVSPMHAIENQAPATRGAERCLRLGVLQDGTLVEERLVRGLGEVTAGPSPRSTIILPATGAIADGAVRLFSRTPAGFFLHLDARVDGVVEIAGAAPARLGDLARQARR